MVDPFVGTARPRLEPHVRVLDKLTIHPRIVNDRWTDLSGARF
jgi:hypothetical protein